MAEQQSQPPSLIQRAAPATLSAILIFTAFCTIVWNENRFAHVTSSGETLGVATVAPPALTGSNGGGFKPKSIASSPIDPSNNGRIVYVVGMAKTSNTLSDGGFDLQRVALRLKRDVYMFQWRHVKNPENPKQMLLQKVWSRKLIDDSGFNFRGIASKFRNPKAIAIKEKEVQASDVRLGDFKLSVELVKAIPFNTRVDMSTVDVVKVRDKFTKPVEVKHDGQFLVIGGDPKKPVIGDIRVGMKATEPQVVSIIAVQDHGVLVPIDGKQVILKTGKISKETLLGKEKLPDAHKKAEAEKIKSKAIASAKTSKGSVTKVIYQASWQHRLIALALMVAGFVLLGHTLTGLNLLVNSQAYLVSAGVGASVALLLMAYQGFSYHPFLSIIFVVLAGGSGYFSFGQYKAGSAPVKR